MKLSNPLTNNIGFKSELLTFMILKVSLVSILFKTKEELLMKDLRKKYKEKKMIEQFNNILQQFQDSVLIVNNDMNDQEIVFYNTSFANLV